MKDRASSRVNMMAAELARVRPPRGYLVMLRNLAARLTKDTVGIEIILEPVKASIIGWKLALEILERVTLHFRALNFGLFGWHRGSPYLQ